MIDNLIIGLCIVIALYFLWDLLCINKTYKQRVGYLEIRSLITHEDHYESLSHEDRFKWLSEAQIIFDGMKEVTYNQHRYALLLFKNPLNLYPEDFRNLVTKSN